jgi:uncharacterized membrane protein (Fun14 family)
MKEDMLSQGIQQVSEQVSEKASGMFATAKDGLKDTSNMIFEKFKDYKGNIIEVAVYAGIGFLVGFLFKKYIKYILLLILFIVSLVILEQFDILHTNINWAKMQELFNLKSTADAFNAQVAQSYIEWAKANFVVVFSASVGFLIGLKLG